ncbi:Origin recognition complex, subunit 1 [Linnemannia hyalina]|uniref:Origin recognition complex subunit 1 n=1 Tax=Linnemannia hyalina TaxID=64524 RepID=A0A9P7XPB7_9FUNG|nr:Origin recognition complex, subunit 1 [Linnemannia hyalina]
MVTTTQRVNNRLAKAKSQAQRDILYPPSDSDSDDDELEWVGEPLNKDTLIRRTSSKTTDSSDIPSRKATRGSGLSNIPYYKAFKKGDTIYSIGDIVLLRNEQYSQRFDHPYIAQILSLWETEDGDCEGDFRWFHQGDDIAKLRRYQRTGNFPESLECGEIVYTLDDDKNDINTVIAKGKVLNEMQWREKFGEAGTSLAIEERDMTFFCRVQEQHEAERSDDDVRDQAYSERASDLEQETSEEESDESTKNLPEKRQPKKAVVATPKKRPSRNVAKIPSRSKSLVIKTPTTQRSISATAPKTDFEHARNRLHVKAVPDSLPCREDEFLEIQEHLESAIEDGTGSCIYISGVPGTGKTATVLEVIRSLQAKAEEGIVESRLEGIQAFRREAIEFAARKVGAVSGDARRALDICRRAVEIVETNAQKAEDQRRLKAGRNPFEDLGPAPDPEQVTIRTVDQAIKEMFASPNVRLIQTASLHQKLFLVALTARLRRLGLAEVEFSEIAHAHLQMCRLHNIEPPMLSDLSAICASLGSSRCLLVESGKQDLHQRVRLSVSEEDVIMALKVDPLFRRLLDTLPSAPVT